MMTASGMRGGSENLGTKWVVTPGDLKVTIENNASYAKWVHGTTMQAHHMRAIGWRKLIDVAKESRGSITTIFNRWVNKLLRDLKL